MKRVRLVFGTHNSLPAGLSPAEKEEVYRRSFKPFLMVLYNYPRIGVSLHYSGMLLQWLEKEHPEFITVLCEMIDRKQVELLGGAFFEPFLPLIPDADRVGQIEMYTTYVRKLFGRRPRGCWLPRHVWDPSLASVLKRCGMEYFFLSENDFLASGFTVRDITTPSVVEDQGKPVTVLPISREAAYLVPFAEPRDILETITRYSDSRADSLFSLLVPGDKLGYRDSTYQRCYDEKWLSRFLDILLEKADEIETVHPTNHLRSASSPRPRAYFPPSTYDDLTSWSRRQEQENAYPAEREAILPRGSRSSYRGSYFRQFLSDYPESRRLYDRMLYSSLLVTQVKGDQYRKKAAREELWRGQNHCAYWYSRDIGIYRNACRKEAYAALIEAERLTRIQGAFMASLTPVDIDMDGIKEYLYRGYKLNAFVHALGGALFELDHMRTGWNYLDTMARHRESCHDGESDNYSFDRSSRYAFLDHFLLPDETLVRFLGNKHKVCSTFHENVYEVINLNRESSRVEMRLERAVSALRTSTRIRVDKGYRFTKDGVEVTCSLFNQGPREIHTLYACEIHLSFASAEPSDQQLFLCETGQTEFREIPLQESELSACEEISFQDNRNNLLLNLRVSGCRDLWVAPFFTEVMTPEGWEREYQSTLIMPRWEVSLTPGETLSLTLSLTLKKA